MSLPFGFASTNWILVPRALVQSYRDELSRARVACLPQPSQNRTSGLTDSRVALVTDSREPCPERALGADG